MIMVTVHKCMALLVATAPVPGASTTLPEGLAGTTIPNFQMVKAGLYRGGRPRPADVVTLARQDIKTIVNLQGKDALPGIKRGVEVYQPGERPSAIAAERALAESLGIRYLHLPFNSLRPVSEEDAAQILRVVRIISDPANYPLFIHCEHGRDRTGLPVSLARVLYQRWPPQRAFDEWVALGHAGWLTLKFTGNLDAHFNRVMREHGLPEVMSPMLELAPTKSIHSRRHP